MNLKSHIVLVVSAFILSACVSPPPTVNSLTGDLRNNFYLAQVNYEGDWDGSGYNEFFNVTRGAVSQQKVSSYVKRSLQQGLSDQTGRVGLYLDVSCRVVIPTGFSNVLLGIGGTYTPNQMACFAQGKTSSGKIVFGPGFINFTHEHKKVEEKLARRDKILKNMSDRFASIVRNSLLGYGGPMLMDVR